LAGKVERFGPEIVLSFKYSLGNNEIILEW